MKLFIGEDSYWRDAGEKNKFFVAVKWCKKRFIKKERLGRIHASVIALHIIGEYQQHIRSLDLSKHHWAWALSAQTESGSVTYSVT